MYAEIINICSESNRNRTTRVSIQCKDCDSLEGYQVKVRAISSNPEEPHEFTATVENKRRDNVRVKLKRTDADTGWTSMPITLILEENTDIRNCKQIHDHGNRESGIYKVYSSNQRKLTVYCDMDTDGGGWTVFQRREDGSVNFYRNWKEYRTGFGEPDQEFWMGLDNLHYLSGEEKYELRVEMRNCVNVTKYAQYSSFNVGPPPTFTLSVHGYSGTAGNSLAIHNGQPFSAYDNDQDIYGTNCAFRDKGAWWYKGCHHANLNGLYQPCKVAWTSASWYSFDDEHQGLRFIEMKVRPL